MTKFDNDELRTKQCDDAECKPSECCMDNPSCAQRDVCPKSNRWLAPINQPNFICMHHTCTQDECCESVLTIGEMSVNLMTVTLSLAPELSDKYYDAEPLLEHLEEVSDVPWHRLLPMQDAYRNDGSRQVIVGILPPNWHYDYMSQGEVYEALKDIRHKSGLESESDFELEAGVALTSFGVMKTYLYMCPDGSYAFWACDGKSSSGKTGEADVRGFSTLTVVFLVVIACGIVVGVMLYLPKRNSAPAPSAHSIMSVDSRSKSIVSLQQMGDDPSSNAAAQYQNF
jgi:hypothetical protein